LKNSAESPAEALNLQPAIPLNKPRLLFLTSRFPYPLEKGDKLRAYHFIRQLSHQFDIFLFALNEHPPEKKNIEALQPWCREIETAVITKADSVKSMLTRHHLPFQVAYFYTTAAQKKLNAFVERTQPEMVFSHLIRTAEYARKLPLKIKALDYMDTFSRGIERLNEKGPLWMKLPTKVEHQRLLRYENEVFNDFSHHFIISAQDRDFIPHPEKATIDVIPNGVDFHFFHPIEREKKYDLLFNGHLSYPPNIASAVYSAKEIFPALKKIHPSASLLLAGANPVQKVTALEEPGIKVQGWMDDIRDAYAESRVMIAPMLISIGLQNKILQAMAMKIPCVVSPNANNALGARHGEEVFVANTPEEYARYIHLLLTNAEAYTQMAEKASRFVFEHFSWESHSSSIHKKLTGQLK
jgi:sugar transferase (PEP-CTERM/EpsH1 system associated)